MKIEADDPESSAPKRAAQALLVVQTKTHETPYLDPLGAAFPFNGPSSNQFGLNVLPASVETHPYSKAARGIGSYRLAATDC